MKRLFLIVLCACVSLWLRADSPLTSTYFCSAYRDLPLIAQAMFNSEQGNHLLSSEYISFLDDSLVALDEKLALINALGWGDTSNTEIFKQHLISKYHLQLQDVNNWCNADYLMDSLDNAKIHALPYYDLTLFAYMQAMGDYFNPLRAIYFSEAAMDNEPTSESVIWIQGLLMAQFYLDVDWCAVYMVFQDVDARTSSFEKDFIRPEAKAIVMEYINLYQQACIEQMQAEEAIATESATIYDGAYFYQFVDAYWVEHPIIAIPKDRQLRVKKEFADLELMNNPKEFLNDTWVFYEQEIDGTRMNIRIKNNGTIASIETSLEIRITDVYMGALDGQTSTLVMQQAIPPLAVGEETIIVVDIPGYWIYDPDAVFTIKVDNFDLIEERNEEDNFASYSENG